MDHDANDEPNDDEDGEHPEQERAFSDGEPAKLDFFHAEPGTPSRRAAVVVLEDLASSSFGGIVNDAAARVDIDDAAHGSFLAGFHRPLVTRIPDSEEPHA
jgi:hypothetical protein